ncbi:hypothetical protein O7626_38230 [Micromonospora sp. WMMD1102]|uniref:hypothetical protein n=1 Tax=Micromonospora sp. WMMD1102 TaxID=3016105 RepID=UPI002414F2B6|nr:hypothetical protein [Micromonospora sp. WMMD1102]MDG4791667.1 hypothetical protein [Micromonospora sp. WMMD1102]
MRPHRIIAAGLAVALLGSLAAATPGYAAPAAPATSTANGATAALGSAGCPTDPATPKRQFRAMWIASVVNID